MQCWPLCVLYSWQSWLVSSSPCIAPSSLSKSPGTTDQSNLWTNHSNLRLTNWSGEGGLFEGQEYWILHRPLGTSLLLVGGPTEILSPMHSTPEQHPGPFHHLQLTILGEDMTGMIRIILNLKMSLLHLPMHCLGGLQHPRGAQLKQSQWGRSRKKSKCFSVQILIQSELLVKSWREF